MRYPASEKLEIIRLVEQSHLPAGRTLEKLGILRSTFYRWYDRYQAGGPEALEDRPSTPRQVWNRIPDEVRERIVDLALDAPELSPRELATRFTDKESYFVSEASVYRFGTPKLKPPTIVGLSRLQRTTYTTRQCYLLSAPAGCRM
jgi:transposase-like protein